MIVNEVIYDEGVLYTHKHFPPKKGGTFLYCQFPVVVQIPKFDRIGRKTGRFIEATRPCNHRVRKFRTYVRHWKRVHGGEWPS